MKLHYTRAGEDSTRLMILHGLFGSERNWLSVVRELSPRFTIVVPDLRNHGQSPHHPEHSIPAMRRDIEELSEELGWSSFALLGHSMGGYVAMDFALHHPDAIEALIIEDIAPRTYPNDTLGTVIQAMRSVDFHRAKTKSDVDKQLSLFIPDPIIRQFLLTNINSSSQPMTWRIHLVALENFVRSEFSGIQFPKDRIYDKPTLFIGGMNSPYRLDREGDLIRQYFPRAIIEMIPDAGHWPHYEQKEHFIALIKDFILTQNFT